MIFGKTFSGSFTSSAMFTESSKPTMAKKARVVAVLTAMKIDLSSGVSNMITRDRSALPPPMANRPTRMTSTRPLSSTRVKTMLAFTLSATPRRLIKATRHMKASARMVVRPSLKSAPPSPIQSSRTTLTIASRLEAKARAAVEAEVIPEHITVKQTRKVTKCTPKALCV